MYFPPIYTDHYSIDQQSLRVLQIISYTIATKNGPNHVRICRGLGQAEESTNSTLTGKLASLFYKKYYASLSKFMLLFF